MKSFVKGPRPSRSVVGTLDDPGSYSDRGGRDTDNACPEPALPLHLKFPSQGLQKATWPMRKCKTTGKLIAPVTILTFPVGTCHRAPRGRAGPGELPSRLGPGVVVSVMMPPPTPARPWSAHHGRRRSSQPRQPPPHGRPHPAPPGKIARQTRAVGTMVARQRALRQKSAFPFGAGGA